MSTELSSPNPTMTDAAATRRFVALLLGPGLCLLGLLEGAEKTPYPEFFLTYGLWAVVLAWSPLPWSLPAILLDHDRDTALAGMRWLPRTVALIPWMLTRSAVRVEFAISVVWFVVLATFAVTGVLS